MTQKFRSMKLTMQKGFELKIDEQEKISTPFTQNFLKDFGVSLIEILNFLSIKVGYELVQSLRNVGELSKY